MRGIASQESPSNPYVLRVNSNALHSAYAELKAGHSHVMLNISQQPNTLKALLKPFKKTWADATPSTPAHPVYALPAGIDPKGFSRDDMPLNWLDLLIKTINSSSSIKTVSINAAYLKFNKAGSTSERDYTGLGAEDEEEGEATGPESAPQQKRLSDEEIEAEVKKAFAHVTPDALNQRAQAAFDKLMVNTEQCRKFVKKHKLLPDIESELAEHQEYLDSLPAERRAKAESVEARRKRLEATPVDMKKLKDKLLEIEQADYESAKAAKRQYLKTIIPASSSALHELFSPKKETQIGGAASSGGAAGGAGHIASETALLNKEDFLNFVIALSKLQKKGANSKFTIEAAPDAPLLLSLYLDHSDLLSGNIQFILTECRFNFLSLHNNEHPVKTEILSKPSGNQDHRLMFVAKVPEDYLNERWVINPVDVIKLGENLQSAARQSSMARGLSIFSPSISRASTLSRPSVSRHDEPAYTHWDFSILLTDPDSTKLESLPFASGTCSVIIKNRIVQDSLPVYDKGHLAELIETVYRFGQLPSLSKFEAVKEQVRLQTRTARLINYAELTLSDAEKIAEASAQLQHLLNSGIKIVDMPNRDEFKIWPKEVQEIVQQKAKAITRVIELRAQLSSQPFEQRKYHTITSVPGFEHLPEADQAKLREHIHINSKAQSILLELLRGAPKKEWEKFYKSTEFKSLAQSDQDRIKELANQPPASTLPSGAAAPAPATVPVRLVHAETA
ncbi:MAG: hypothetical protein K0S29_379, partial [Gammaproteobacteria bacterium]|nr:hypothetical protein [Gammaproteobacteria bacterium]